MSVTNRRRTERRAPTGSVTGSCSYIPQEVVVGSGVSLILITLGAVLACRRTIVEERGPARRRVVEDEVVR